jgi:anti-anti-sigma regulatory factor
MSDPAPTSPSELVLEGELTAETVAALHQRLCAHLAQGGAPVVHAGEVALLDGACAQLLYAFARQVAQAGGALRWASASRELVAAARTLGLVHHLGLGAEAAP